MKGGNKLFMIGGVGLALIAIALGVISYTGGGKADAQKDATPAKVTVVQAASDLSAHTVLAATDLVETQVPNTEVPADAVRSSTQVLGLSYRVPLVKGQRLVMSQTEQPGLRNDIKVGLRAISLPVTEVSSLSGLIQDGDYVDVVFHARINLVRLLPTTGAITPEDQPYYIFSGNKLTFLAPDIEQPNHPFTGDPGSNFIIRDDTGEAQQLEPVAKILLQDVRVLRVVAPGQSFGSNGQHKGKVGSNDVPVPADQNKAGFLVLEVAPSQAELLTFMQDKRHEYQVVVRGKDDHAKVPTNGITFQILATSADYALPWPKSLSAPKEQTKGQPGKPAAAATPVAKQP